MVMTPITNESLPYIYPKQAYPTSSKARLALGEASNLSSLGQHDKAIAVLDIAINDCNPNPYLFYNRGYYHSLEANFEKAIPDYQRCLDLEPHNPTGWNCYGYALARNGQQNDAIRAYSQAIDQHPSEGAQYFLRAASFLMAGDLTRMLADMDAGMLRNGVVQRRLIGEVLGS